MMALPVSGAIKRRPIGFEGIAFGDGELPWIALRDFLERRQAASIALDSDDALCAFEQQCPREAARTGADLHHSAAGEGTCSAGDAAR